MATQNRKQAAELVELAAVIKHSPAAISHQKARVGEVFNHMLKNSKCIEQPDFQTISPADLGMLFQATDEIFFNGLVGKACEHVASHPLSFRLSTRMTSTGGMTTMQRPVSNQDQRFQFEIAIATTPLFESFKRSEKASVGGIACQNRLEALQRIMEHEMVHLIELLLTKDSNCSASPFKRIVADFFGHTESNHRLLTPKDIARTRLGIRPGDRVNFDCDGRTFNGFLQRITKRATVLVLDSKGHQYDDGKRYAKYYVPLKKLRRA